MTHWRNLVTKPHNYNKKRRHGRPPKDEDVNWRDFMYNTLSRKFISKTNDSDFLKRQKEYFVILKKFNSSTNKKEGEFFYDQLIQILDEQNELNLLNKNR
jgi:hypothetical protein